MDAIVFIECWASLNAESKWVLANVGGGGGGCDSDPSVRRRRGSGVRLQPTSTVAPQKPKTRRPIIIIMELDSFYSSSRIGW